jgi:hypothetical protein
VLPDIASYAMGALFPPHHEQGIVSPLVQAIAPRHAVQAKNKVLLHLSTVNLSPFRLDGWHAAQPSSLIPLPCKMKVQNLTPGTIATPQN